MKGGDEEGRDGGEGGGYKSAQRALLLLPSMSYGGRFIPLTHQAPDWPSCHGLQSR
jgi:hypothetical protein